MAAGALLSCHPTAVKTLPLVATAAFSLAVLSCSSSKSTPTGAAGTPGDGGSTTTADGGFANLPASATTFDMSFTVGPSTEDFECTYVQMPATAGFIVGGQHELSVGSHHLLIYSTNLTSIPAGLASPTLGGCYDATAGYMNTITGAVYPAATPSGELTMPAGVGLPYAANAIYMFQVHYLNSTASSVPAHASVHLTTQTTPVQQNAGVLFFYDPFIYVAQGGMATASMRCPISKDITMFTEGSHYHARGVNYQAYIDTATTPATTPFYTSNLWESPTIQLQSIPVSAGSYIRYYCDYNNTLANADPGTITGTQAFIQGPSALDNEMCMFIGMYYPAIDTSTEQCDNGDTYGTGTVSCTDTLTALGACPPDEDAGPQGVAFNSCIQQAFVNSCPNAAGPLTTALNCIQSNCGTQCSGSSTTCTSCVTTNCAAQYEACSSVACGTVPPIPGQ
jgi:hypothetical protein